MVNPDNVNKLNWLSLQIMRYKFPYLCPGRSGFNNDDSSKNHLMMYLNQVVASYLLCHPDLVEGS